MITGKVNYDLTPYVELDVCGPLGDRVTVNFLFDTGFNGQITLRSATIATLSLRYLGRDNVKLADGTYSYVELYEAVIVWEGQDRNVTVAAMEDDPLLGTEMLLDHDVYIGFINGGPLTIQRRP